MTDDPLRSELRKLLVLKLQKVERRMSLEGDFRTAAIIGLAIDEIAQTPATETERRE